MALAKWPGLESVVPGGWDGAVGLLRRGFLLLGGFSGLRARAHLGLLVVLGLGFAVLVVALLLLLVVLLLLLLLLLWFADGGLRESGQLLVDGLQLGTEGDGTL